MSVNIIINEQAMNVVWSELDKRLEKVGTFVENTAKDNCPYKTHTLQNSIQHSDVENHSITIGTNVDYAIPVHEGHGTYAGVPFLKDAVFGHMSEIQSKVGGK